MLRPDSAFTLEMCLGQIPEHYVQGGPKKWCLSYITLHCTRGITFLSHPVYTTLFSATVHNNMSHDKLRNVSRLVDDDICMHINVHRFCSCSCLRVTFNVHRKKFYTICVYYINRTIGTQTLAYNKCTQSEISAQTAHNVRYIRWQKPRRQNSPTIPDQYTFK